MTVGAPGTLTITFTAPPSLVVGEYVEVWGLTTLPTRNGLNGPVQSVSGNSITMNAPNQLLVTTTSETGYVIGKRYGLICNLTQNGTQQSWVLRDVAMEGNASATNPGPLLRSTGTFIGTLFDHIQTVLCEHDCVLIEPGNPGPGAENISSDITIFDSNLADTQTTGDYPGCVLAVNSLNSWVAGAGVSLIQVTGGAIEDQGPHNPLLCINGNALGGTGGIHINTAPDWELGPTTPGTSMPNVDPIQINDAWSTYIGSTRIEGAIGTGPQHLVDITQNPGYGALTYDVQLKSFAYAHTWIGSPLTSAINVAGNQTFTRNAVRTTGGTDTFANFVYSGSSPSESDYTSLTPETTNPPFLISGECWFNTTLDPLHPSCTPDGSTIYSMAWFSDINAAIVNGALTGAAGADILLGIGSFATGNSTTPTGWQTACGGSLTCVFLRDNSTAPPGSTYSEKITINANSAPSSQTPGADIATTASYAITAGQAYTVSFSAQSDGTTTANPFYVLTDNAFATIYCTNFTLFNNVVSPSTWTHYNYACTPASSVNAYVRIGAYWRGGNTGSIWIGSLVITPVLPLPPNSILSSIGPYTIGPASNAQQTVSVNGTNCQLGGSCAPFPVLSGATSTITGTSLSTTCDSGTATVSGAVVGHTVGVSRTDGTDLGGAFYVRASVTATNTVTVYVCGTGTPPSKAYNVTTY